MHERFFQNPMLRAQDLLELWVASEEVPCASWYCDVQYCPQGGNWITIDAFRCFWKGRNQEILETSTASDRLPASFVDKLRVTIYDQVMLVLVPEVRHVAWEAENVLLKRMSHSSRETLFALFALK